ncbi:hypothetical protein BANRA_00581 [Acinetobacter baumannii]|nr:hypothetical protein BANRA_00581 [Acinetobacter baumannii]
MTIFVRKISKAKWPSEEEIAEKALDSEIIPFVRADALTTCLKLLKILYLFGQLKIVLMLK